MLYLLCLLALNVDGAAVSATSRQLNALREKRASFSRARVPSMLTKPTPKSMLTTDVLTPKKKSLFAKNPLRGALRAAKHAVKSSVQVPLNPAARNRKSGERYTSADWFRNIYTLIMLKSDILKRISGHLAFNILLAASGAYWWTTHPESFVKLGMSLHSLTGAALSLLLVFRTNSAYDRFWEARKILGKVVDKSRGLSRVAPGALPPKQAVEFGKMIIAFPYMLRLHLTGRGQVPIKYTTDAPDVLHFFNKEQLEHVENYFSKPMSTLSIMNQVLNDRDAQYPGEDSATTLSLLPQRQVLQDNVNELVAATGACERILACPVPLSYSRHLSRFLTIWSATLPLALAPTLGWLSVPVIATICWSLFSIEEVGHMIEEPFAALPYDQVQTKRVADVIKRDTINMYKQQLGVDIESPAVLDGRKSVEQVQPEPQAAK